MKLIKGDFKYSTLVRPYFICGEIGGKDKDGLPDKIEVSPVEGADYTVVYERKDKEE